MHEMVFSSFPKLRRSLDYTGIVFYAPLLCKLTCNWFIYVSRQGNYKCSFYLAAPAIMYCLYVSLRFISCFMANN